MSEKTKNASGIGNPEEERSFGYPPAEIKADGAYGWYEQKTHTEYCYGIVTYRKGNVIYYTLASSNDDENYVQAAKNRLKRAAESGFEKLHEAHRKHWRAYNGKSAVKTGDKLIDETYRKSWYLFGSCSRKGFYPMPLQGVWTADNDCRRHGKALSPRYEHGIIVSVLFKGESFGRGRSFRGIFMETEAGV